MDDCVRKIASLLNQIDLSKDDAEALLSRTSSTHTRRSIETARRITRDDIPLPTLGPEQVSLQHFGTSAAKIQSILQAYVNSRERLIQVALNQWNDMNRKYCEHQAIMPSSTRQDDLNQSRERHLQRQLYLLQWKALQSIRSILEKHFATERPQQILKSWLLDNLSDPYPNELQKMVLCQKTGLNIIQLNEW
ncbi:hypothetical protein HK102_008012 [Quaeritorhiza haematococci]|nr:hypothetical protein HK102_008012 [Quaeritorhiza haematococci]